jgi:hypothetical protein
MQYTGGDALGPRSSEVNLAKMLGEHKMTVFRSRYPYFKKLPPDFAKISS